MVYFICNNCGESLKKPQVDQHLGKTGKFTRCRNCSVSCMDCHRDFDMNTYVKHTKCISEQEKYSGGNFKPKASTLNKAVKQDKWIELVHRVATKQVPNRPGPVQRLLDHLVNCQSVPCKEKPFWNFAATLPSNVRNESATSTVWMLLCKEKEEAATQEQENKQKKEEVQQEQIMPKVGPGECSSDPPKVDDRKVAFQRLADAGGPFADAFQALAKMNDVPTSSKKKFKAFVKQSVPGSSDANAMWKSFSNELESVAKEAAAQPKTKKAKRKACVEENGSPKKIKLNEDLQEQDTMTPTKGGKFPWKKAIVRALTSSKDNSLTMKKLTRKVLAEYESSGIISAESKMSKDQLQAKLSKTVAKLSNVVTKNDSVSLINGSE